MWSLLKEAAFGWINDNASRLSAALAYYSIFSLAPLLIIVMFVVAMVFGADAADGTVYDQLSSLLGSQVAETVQTWIKATNANPRSGWIATSIGMAVLLFGATTVFTELKNALNTIWGVEVRSGRAIRTLLRDRFLSFSMVLGIGFLLLVSMMVSAGLAAVSTFMSSTVALPSTVWQVTDFFVSLLVTGLLFAMIFKVLPNVILEWQDVAAGGLITALLFNIGKAGIAMYLTSGGVASSFGAAGIVVIILLWVYYATSILFFGAEFTKAWVRSRVGYITPHRRAYLVSEGEEIPAKEAMKVETGTSHLEGQPPA